ncbi:MAG: sodium-independent anion transporter, partial [Comamonas sp.]
DFASAAALERYITQTLQQRSGIRVIFLDAQPINRIDVTGIESFIRLRNGLKKQGIGLHIGGLKLPVQSILEKSGALVQGADLQLSRTCEQALLAIRVSSATI